MELKSRSTVVGSYGSPWCEAMRARIESLGMLRLPTTCGWQSGPLTAASVGCAAACASDGTAVSSAPKSITARDANPRTPPKEPKRICTDFQTPGGPPLTRFTVKIRTPSLLWKSHPGRSFWGSLDYMGARPPGASSVHCELARAGWTHNRPVRLASGGRNLHPFQLLTAVRRTSTRTE